MDSCMISKVVVLSILMTCITAKLSSPDISDHAQPRENVVFYDDFSSGFIDPQKWAHDVQAIGLGDYEIMSPEPLNSYVKNGTLYIKPTLTTDRFGEAIMTDGTIDCTKIWGSCQPMNTDERCVTRGNQNRGVISALLRSSGSIKYGRVEVEAQLPLGDWLWPAIWMMPKDSVYGGWPQSGEIDIMEAAGNLHLFNSDNTLSMGVDCDRSTIHYGTQRLGPGHIRHGEKYHLNGTTFADGFHTYWADWTQDYIKLGVDNHTNIILNTPPQGFWNASHLNGTDIWAKGGKNAPFDQEFYVILNVAVAGGFFGDDVNQAYPKPYNASSPWGYHQFWEHHNLWYPTWHGEDVAMKVKSVKMVQY